ncbi:ATP-grasp domain-containing protein [Subtercola endophyticus]|uniref:ATP-grasp domain-containing protein n=1 Tax=Subtercola endophyticus TaxID=2895559 RepID=UPI001E3D4E5A|nr:alpha-L-glutamate ligase [Subtercola endophyticus]UFS59135.1 alpha-L-glutamate ligase [Subtercola endophyticus]
MPTTPRVYIIHENPEWLPPLEAAFTAIGTEVSEILVTAGSLDLGSRPEPGVYWSRLSASSHTRGHADSKEYARALLTWLESNGARVVNGRSVVEFEVSKVQQHQALSRAGFDVPRTTAVFGRSELKSVARTFETPFISKHNQGGKGLGVRRFDSHDEFDRHVDSAEFEPSPDGVTLIQEYLVAREPFVTRVEFVGGRYVYAVRVDISSGSFELCPADACAVDADADEPGAEPAPLFALRAGFDDDPLIARYEAFLADSGIEIAGIEFIETADGRRVTYDINTNTNYNPDVEAASQRSGPDAIARYLTDLLAEQAPADHPATDSTGQPTDPDHPIATASPTSTTSTTITAPSTQKALA